MWGDDRAFRHLYAPGRGVGRERGQGAMEAGEVFEGGGFGADLGVEMRGPGSLEESGGEASVAEVFCKGFAFLGESLVEEAIKGGGMDAEFSETGMEAEAEDGGVNFGGWGEGVGTEGEEDLGDSVHLGGGGEEAEVAATGRGGDALGDLALHHEHGGGEEAGGGEGGAEEMEQDIGGDVVGEVADDVDVRGGVVGVALLRG